MWTEITCTRELNEWTINQLDDPSIGLEKYYCIFVLQNLEITYKTLFSKDIIHLVQSFLYHPFLI